MPFEVWALVLDGRRIKPSILRPSYFLVDGDDWLAHIQRSKDFKNATVADTIALDEITRKLHGELNVMGIQPIVFLEKAQSKYPKNSKSPSKSDSNRALLQQFRKSLKCLSVDIEECDCMRREGAMLAFLRTVGARAAYSCYIYGSALLDLWAVRGISYILFDSLSISEIGDKVQAPVWNKSIVAAALFVTELQLAELMILVGNRHTKPYGRKGYRSASGGGVPNSFLEIENEEVKGIKSHSTEPKTDDMVSLAAMRDWILQQGTNFKLRFLERFSLNVKGPFTSVDQAIEFSRAYYDNRDLTPFYEAIELAESSSSKSETPRPPTNPTVAAAMIMSAISGSTTVSSSRTVTITSGKKAAYDPYTGDIKVAETADKSKQRKKEKEYSKQSAELENLTHREGDADGRRAKKEKTDRKEKKDLSASVPASSPTAVASTASGGIDAGKGNQLKNLLGIKFGSISSPAVKSAATSQNPTASEQKVELKDGGGDSALKPLSIDTQMVVESSTDISVPVQGSAGGKTSKSARTAGKSSRSDGSAPPTPTHVRLAPGPGFSDSSPAPVETETLCPLNTELPIDAHRSKILAHIDAHPVTIIQGVTGCGKSSRYAEREISTVTVTVTVRRSCHLQLALDSSHIASQP
jgi:hypothetical protein